MCEFLKETPFRIFGYKSKEKNAIERQTHYFIEVLEKKAQ